jgi:Tfp pilus assembly protein FimT
MVELILVMVVVCIILGMASPSLRGFFTSRQTSNAAAQIMALIQYARTQSIASGCNYRLNFDTTQNTYWLTVQSGSDFVAINTERGMTFSLPEGASFNLQADPNSTVTDHIDFYPNGSTSAASIGVIGRQGDEQRISSGDNLTLTDSYRIIAPAAATTGGSRS